MQKPENPNVVLFVMDCVRPDHMSCYGYAKKTTPNIDRIAKESVLFQQAITTSGWTLPTHASLFTGAYPPRHGANREHLFLDNHLPTMAELAQTQGYQTAGFSSVGYVSRETGLDRGFEQFHESFDKDGVKKHTNSFLIRYKLKRMLSLMSQCAARDTIPGKIVNWKVKSWFRKRDTSKPFFLFIHYIDAHKPYRYNRYYHRLFLESEQKVETAKQWSDYNWPQLTLNNHRLDKQILNALYDSKIFSVDYCIAELIEMLKKNNLYDDTLLIVTADHGEIVTEIFDHHFYLNEDVLHIPLILRYPKVFTPGTVREDLVSIVDILPTMLEVIGVDNPVVSRTLQGTSLLHSSHARSKAKRRSGSSERYVIAQRGHVRDPWFEKFPELYGLQSIPPLDCIRQVIRTERYKYIWSSDGQHELYDLADEGEAVNLINTHTQIAEKLKKMLFEATEGEYSSVTPDKNAEIEQKLRKSLEGLGYL